MSLWNAKDKKSNKQQNRKKLKKPTSELEDEKDQDKNDNSNELFIPKINVRLSDLEGLDSCIEDLKDNVFIPLLKPELFLHSKIQAPRGLLLYGPPGCGKTTLANAIAGELKLPFFPISAPTIVSGMSGESERNLRLAFDQAKKMAPSIIFIDEIDAIAPKRDNIQREMERRIVSQLITCMDGLNLENNNGKPVVLIGATNRPESIDSALRRAGRFDKEISMPIPNEEARTKILEKMCQNLPFENEFDFKKLARNTPGYVCADLTALVSGAGIIAIKRYINQINKSSYQKDLTTTLQISSDFNQFLESLRPKLPDHVLNEFKVQNEDFDQALKTIQPASKREGFVTVPNVTWEDIGALENIRQELRMSVVEPIKHSELYKKIGITSSAGVLLWGPPGCGKTLLAKAVANESHSNFISVKGPELLNKYVGESERSIRQVFSRAQASSPCVIFFDEIDAICSKRDSSQSEVGSRVVNTFLTELDGMESRKKVFVIGATNRPDMIDSAILRPGRFDKLLYVGLPSALERTKILEALTKNTPLDKDVSLQDIASMEQCNNYSGADLSGLVREASLCSLKEIINRSKDYNKYIDNTLNDQDKQTITTVSKKHFIQAVQKTNPSVSENERKMFENLKRKLNGN